MWSNVFLYIYYFVFSDSFTPGFQIFLTIDVKLAYIFTHCVLSSCINSLSYPDYQCYFYSKNIMQNWVASKLSGVSVVTAKESVQNIPYLSDVSFYEWRKKATADETDRQQATWWQGTANTDRQQHDDGGQLTQTDSNLGEWISCLDRSTGMHACIILNSSMHVQVHPLFLLPLAARGQ